MTTHFRPLENAGNALFAKFGVDICQECSLNLSITGQRKFDLTAFIALLCKSQDPSCVKVGWVQTPDFPGSFNHWSTLKIYIVFVLIPANLGWSLMLQSHHRLDLSPATLVYDWRLAFLFGNSFLKKGGLSGNLVN